MAQFMGDIIERMRPGRTYQANDAVSAKICLAGLYRSAGLFAAHWRLPPCASCSPRRSEEAKIHKVRYIRCIHALF